MAGTLPINDFAQVTITSNQPTMITTSISGLRQAKQVAGQFWTVEAEYRNLTSSEAKTVQGFLSKQRGTLYDFSVVIPVISDADGGIQLARAANPAVDDTFTVASNYSVGAATIAFTTNFTQGQYTGAGATTILQAGDYVRFAGHSKVYQVTEDVVPDGSGNGTMVIYPNLVATVTSGEELIYNQVPFTVFNTEVAKDTTFSLGNETQMSLRLQEAL